MIAHGAHQDYLLEVRNVDHLHVCSARLCASGTAGWERVDLVLHDIIVVYVVHHGRMGRGHLRVHLRSVVLWSNFCGGCLAVGVSKAQRLVLCGSSWVLVSGVFARREDSGRLNRRVAGRVVHGQLERQLLSARHLLECVDHTLQLLVDLWYHLFSLVLLLLQVLRNHGDDALDVSQLPSACGYLEIDVFDAENGSVTLDNLSAEVIGGFDSERESDTSLLYLASGLDLGVLKVAMRA